jgi:hypothetical protein
MADAMAFLLSGFAMVALFSIIERASRQARTVIVEYTI